MSVIALLLGILAHALKQMVIARRAGNWIGWRAYVLGCWPESLLACVCSIALFLALPEIAALIPAMGVMAGSKLLAFLCGYIGNSLADILGERAKQLAGQ